MKLKKRLRRLSRRRLPLELFEPFDELVARVSRDGLSEAASVNVWSESLLTRLAGSDSLLRVMMIGSTGLPKKKTLILFGALLVSLRCTRVSIVWFQGFQDVMLDPEAVVTGVGRSSQVVVNGRSLKSRLSSGIV